MSAPFDLRAEVRTILAETNLSDPGEIADKVADSVPGRSLRAALRQTLRSYVREVIRMERSQFTGGHTTPDAHEVRAAGKSWKRDAIRADWQRMLDGRWSVAGEWRLLREMTHDDLLTAALERQETAERNMAQAAVLRGWADAVKRAKVATFGDLPAKVQESLLTSERAA